MSPSADHFPCHTHRLGAGDLSLARATFNLMAEVFETDAVDDRDAHLAGLLRSPHFWAFSATIDGRVVGGLTGYTLPMARTNARELFVYDLAVHPAYQRRGVATRLMSAARQAANVEGIDDIFVIAENEDAHALAFYRALGMIETPTTMFAYGSAE